MACRTGDGWWFPTDQSQLMLCNPPRFLKFAKVLKINSNANIWKNIRFNNTWLGPLKHQWAGRGWIKNGLKKFSTEPIRLNNIINKNQPSHNSIYVIPTFIGGNSPAYFNVNGLRLRNINKTNTFVYRGETFNTGILNNPVNMTVGKKTIIFGKIFSKIPEKVRNKYANLNASNVMEIKLRKF
jgi:hypothetical protein